MKIYVFDISNIDWDTYDEGTNKVLSPKKLGLPRNVKKFEVAADNEDDAIGEVADQLSDKFGWAVNDFDATLEAVVEPPKKKK